MKQIVRICLGSSCYTRGNEQVLQITKDYIKNHGLEDKIDFRGHLCKGKCNKGPNLSINDKEYHELSESNITTILEEAFQEFVSTE